MLDELEFKRWLQRVTERSGKALEQSGVFLAIAGDSFLREPQCAFEIGLAVMLDKPIYLMVPEGHILPDNLVRLARGLERFDPDDKASLEAATTRLVAAAKRDGVMK